ncbi:MAG TPA: DUF533 domain-containing protein [Usitatibacteraceae bacterium]|nr:DUF533 domain-containing protein [Usitatibacteraceae bacterium]
MTDTEQKALITIALMAAFADGNNSDAERAQVKSIADSLSRDSGADISAIYQDVLLKRVSLDGAIAQLTSAEAKNLAYEFAVCACDADGLRNDAERAFLESLRGKLGIAAGGAESFAGKADRLAEAPVAATSAAEPAPVASTMSAAEQDEMIKNYAILNGALELLPDSLASMAIIPLQMRMVYRVGKSHGYELDRGHIKDFLATAGIGMASQYVEQIGVKLIGKVFGGGLIGGLIGGLAKQTVSSGMSFATTYALGHLAKRYYAGGRTFSTTVIQDTYRNLLGEARSLHGQYLPAIREKARTINVAQILQEVRQ